MTAALLCLTSAGAAHAADFDGDGFSDLVIGVPGDRVGTLRAGGINVLYGSPTGLTELRDQLWSQDSPGVRGGAEDLDGFGSAVATGDFNGDGRSDVAVGAAAETLGDRYLAGTVNVLYGSSVGLTEVGDQMWSQDSLGVPGVTEEGDEFAGSLAVGDFNRDRYADLAIGAPKESIGTTVSAGSVTVLYGSAAGLTSTGSTAWTQSSSGRDNQGAYNLFGESLASGDVNGDGAADLAVGAPGRSYGEDTNGTVHVLLGSTRGLTATGGQVWSQASAGIAEDPENSDEFGAQVDLADHDGNGHADLAVAVPNEGTGQCDDGEGGFEPCSYEGAVHVLYGRPASASRAAGLTAEGSQLWRKGQGLPGPAQAGDEFGSALVSGDFDGDGRFELAVHSSGDHSNAGAVYVLKGGTGGLTASGLQRWTQDSPGVPGAAEPGRPFGPALSVGRFYGGRRDALAVGQPQQMYAPGKGQVVVLPSSTTGLTGSGSQLWRQDSAGIKGVATDGESFGSLNRQGRPTG